MDNNNFVKYYPSYEKEKQEIIFLILNCVKYRNKALFQKDTWINKIPKNIKYYHVLGNPLLLEDYIFDNNENILWVKCLDDYNSLPKKVIRAYKAIFETFDFKYIFKSDDDQYVSNINFFNIISSILKEKENTIHYGGNLLSIKVGHYSLYSRIHKELPNNIFIKPTKYCNGRFYFLSFIAVKNLIKKQNLIENEYIEDYAIGYNLDESLKNHILYLKTDTYFKDFDNFDDWKSFLLKNK